MDTKALTLVVLHQRVLSRIAERVSNGEFSERRLAVELGISQPQIHRVLKGSRGLTPEVADRMLAHLGLSVVDLLDVADTEVYSRPVGLRRKQPERETGSGASQERKTA